MITTGIYKITSQNTGKVYVGESSNIQKRRVRHFCELKNGYHKNQYLQRHVDKYGVTDLIFEIIEVCQKDKKILNEREKYWINFFKSDSPEKGFNLNSGGLGGGWTNIVHKNFYVVNLTTKTTHFFQTISEFDSYNDCHYGKSDVSHHLRDVLNGKRKVCYNWTTIEHFTSLEQKKKQKEEINLLKKNKPKPLPPLYQKNFSLINTVTKEIVNGINITNFCKDRGLTYNSILRVLRGERKTHKNWIKHNS